MMRSLGLNANGSGVQNTFYHPYGKPINGESSGQSAQPYKFNNKEEETMMGLTQYDLGNRTLDYSYNSFNTLDRFAEKYPWQSPYAVAANNPIKYVDVNGDSVNISGTEIQYSLQEAQAYAAGELALTLNDNGTMNAVQTSTGALSENAQKLFDAITSETIMVNIVTISGSLDANGKLVVGGSFNGNVVTSTPDGNTVVATQTINPRVLGAMSSAHGTPGQDVVHEITEPHQGALISQQSGVSSPAAGQPGSVRDQAHANAVPQSGMVTEHAYGVYGMPVPALPNGTYPFPVNRAEWSVTNTSNQKVIIQRFP